MSVMEQLKDLLQKALALVSGDAVEQKTERGCPEQSALDEMDEKGLNSLLKDLQIPLDVLKKTSVDKKRAALKLFVARVEGDDLEPNKASLAAVSELLQLETKAKKDVLEAIDTRIRELEVGAEDSAEESEEADEEAAEEAEEDTGFVEGDQVLAVVDGETYQGEIVAVMDDIAQVKFSNGEVMDVEFADLSKSAEPATDEEDEEESEEDTQEASGATPPYKDELIDRARTLVAFDEEASAEELDEFFEKVGAIDLTALPEDDREWIERLLEYLKDESVPLEDRYMAYCVGLIQDGVDGEDAVTDAGIPISVDGIQYCSALPMVQVSKGKFALSVDGGEFHAGDVVDAATNDTVTVVKSILDPVYAIVTADGSSFPVAPAKPAPKAPAKPAPKAPAPAPKAPALKAPAPKAPAPKAPVPKAPVKAPAPAKPAPKAPGKK